MWPQPLSGTTYLLVLSVCFLFVFFIAQCLDPSSSLHCVLLPSLTPPASLCLNTVLHPGLASLSVPLHTGRKAGAFCVSPNDESFYTLLFWHVVPLVLWRDYAGSVLKETQWTDMKLVIFVMQKNKMASNPDMFPLCIFVYGIYNSFSTFLKA